MNQPSPDRLLERLKACLDRGEVWKAKELATSYVAICYDAELWVACGELFLRTEDRERAGRLLYFAGSKDPGHRDAIKLYLARSDVARLQRDFARIKNPESVPAEVGDGLRRAEKQAESSCDWGCWVAGITFTGIFGLAIWKAIELVKSWLE